MTWRPGSGGVFTLARRLIQVHPVYQGEAMSKAGG
jgi:hypothetical protein